jgi:hypothetical protein
MRPKRQNPELYSAAPISTVSAPGLVDDITATSPGVVATTKALKAYPLLARVRVRRCKPDRADLPVALCASGCGWGPRWLMMKKVKTNSRTTG